MNFRKTVILLLAACASTTLLAADWPQWRGPNCDGVSRETDWNPEALADSKIVWNAEIGTGFSAVSIVNGKAYTMGNINKETDVVYCFDALTGEEKWRYEYTEPLAPKYYEGGCSATPTVYDGKVYTLSKNGVALCLDAETGEVVWKKTLDFKSPTWGFASSVLIVGDMAIYNVGSAGLALNQETGEIIWQSDNDVPGYATPVPYQQDNKSHVCIFGKDSVMGIEAKTGTVLWSYPWKTSYDVNAADPILSGSEVFITSGYNHGCALLRINADKPELVWENKNMRSQMSGPVLIDGYLYGIDDNQLVCVEFKTGELKWAEKKIGKGALCASGEKLIVMGEKGLLCIVQATPEAYKEIASAQVLSGRCWTMPVLANGYIYVRDAKKNAPSTLVCIDVRAKSKTQNSEAALKQDWPQWQGPKRDNLSTETGLLKQWPEDGPKMLWSAGGIGQGYSTVAIAEEKIYMTGMIEEQGMLTCFDLNGKQLWQTGYAPEWKRSYPGARSTPAVVDGSAYVISGIGQVVRINALTGEKVWGVDMYSQFEGQYPNWGYSESPLVLNGKVFFTVGGKKGLMVALDVKDGSVVWATEPNGDKAAFCTPIAFDWAGKMIIITVTSDHIMGIDEKTGAALFSFPVADYVVKNDRAHPNTPIIKDGMIFVSSGRNMGSVQLKLSAEGTSVEKVWVNPDFDNHHGGIVLVDGNLYGANWQSNTQGEWMCVDWQTGKTLYKQEWGNKGSLTYADGMLYCYEEASGTVGLVPATPDRFNPVSTFKITLGDNQHWAHPVVCGKRLYIRHGNALMAFDISG